MKKVMFIVIAVAFYVVYLSVVGAGKPLAGVRKAHADRNKDGQVDRKEIKIEKKRQRIQRSKVNTPREAKADTDNDGVVEPKEAAAAKKYFRKKSVVDRPWEEKADANNDGKVDWKEIRTYHKTRMDTDNNGTITVIERRNYWLKTKSVVNTEYEKKYDTNGDGYLTWAEGKELLKDKHRIIQTKGWAIVNTDLEAEFDANSDGIIDRSEASAILEAVKE